MGSVRYSKPHAERFPHPQKRVECRITAFAERLVELRGRCGHLGPQCQAGALALLRGARFFGAALTGGELLSGACAAAALACLRPSPIVIASSRRRAV